MTMNKYRWEIAVFTSTVAVLFASCGTKKQDATSGNMSDGVPVWTAGGNAGTQVQSNYTTCPTCPAFPAANAPACSTASLAPPKIAYPTNQVLLPPNMNVLEVQFVPPAGATNFEVVFSNANTDVRVVSQCVPVPDVRGGTSRGCGVTLPQAAWSDIANNNRDAGAVSISVRATKDGSCVSQSSDHIDVYFAKEDLAGGIYYWQSGTYGGIAGKTGGIYSHDFGTLDPTPTPFYTSGTNGTCVGCHTVSRDGALMALETDDPDADDEMGDVHSHVMDIATRNILGTTAGGPPQPAGPGAAPGAAGSTLSPGFQSFTHDHLSMVASTYNKTDQNKVFDIFNSTPALASTWPVPSGWQATQPDVSPDDSTLLYVVPGAGTLSSAGDHHFLSGSVYASEVNFATNTLGAPNLLLGSAGTQTFYYPSFAPSGTFIVFNEAPDGDAFYNRKARVKLLHYPKQAGDQGLDLPALNSPPAGTGDTAKLTNSWAKWSPFIQTFHGHKLLWVTFSSNRDYGLHLVNQGFDNCYPPESPDYDSPQPLSKQGVTYDGCAQPQIWMAAIIVDDDRGLDTVDRSFPAFWLPFQDVNAHNHTAQWVEKVQSNRRPRRRHLRRRLGKLRDRAHRLLLVVRLLPGHLPGTVQRHDLLAGLFPARKATFALVTC